MLYVCALVFPFLMCSLPRTLFTLHFCTLYTLYTTPLYTLHYSILCTFLHSLHYTTHTFLHSLHSTRSTLHHSTSFCSIHFCTLYTTPLIHFCTLYTLHAIHYTTLHHSALSTFYILHPCADQEEWADCKVVTAIQNFDVTMLDLDDLVFLHQLMHQHREELKNNLSQEKEKDRISG